VLVIEPERSARNSFENIFQSPKKPPPDRIGGSISKQHFPRRLQRNIRPPATSLPFTLSQCGSLMRVEMKRKMAGKICSPIQALQPIDEPLVDIKREEQFLMNI